MFPKLKGNNTIPPATLLPFTVTDWNMITFSTILHYIDSSVWKVKHTSNSNHGTGIKEALTVSHTSSSLQLLTHTVGNLSNHKISHCHPFRPCASWPLSYWFLFSSHTFSRQLPSQHNKYQVLRSLFLASNSLYRTIKNKNKKTLLSKNTPWHYYSPLITRTLY